jgi:dihydrodipicolinate synthase/N-acetylneuraminate lyase
MNAKEVLENADRYKRASDIIKDIEDVECFAKNMEGYRGDAGMWLGIGVHGSDGYSAHLQSLTPDFARRLSTVMVAMLKKDLENL